MPHQRPTDKKIGPGELVVIDSGAKYAGYHADMTRTVATKGHSEKQKEIYDIVLEAQLKSIDSIKSNISCKEIDSIARDHITNAGYGKYFDHGLGHSLGLEIHENPDFTDLLSERRSHSDGMGDLLRWWYFDGESANVETYNVLVPAHKGIDAFGADWIFDGVSSKLHMNY